MTRIMFLFFLLSSIAFSQYNPGSQEKALARRAAILDGYRLLLEATKGVRIDSQTTVKDFVAESDQINAAAQGFIRGAKILKTRYQADGICEVDMAIHIQDIVFFLYQNQQHCRSNRWKQINFNNVYRYNKNSIIKVTGNGAPPEKRQNKSPYFEKKVEIEEKNYHYQDHEKLRMQREIMELKALIVELKQRQKDNGYKSNGDYEKLRRENKEMAAKLNTMRGRLIELQWGKGSQTKAKEEYENLVIENRNLRLQLQNTQHNNQNNEKLENLHIENKSLRSQISQLNIQIQNLQNNNWSNNQNNCEEWENKCLRLETENQNLRSQMQNYNNGNNQNYHSNIVVELRNENASLHQQISQLNIQIQNLQNSTWNSNTNTNTSSSYRKLQTKYQNLQIENQNLRKQIKVNISGNYTSNNQTIIKLQTENRSLQRQISQLNYQLIQYRSSSRNNTNNNRNNTNNTNNNRNNTNNNRNNTNNTNNNRNNTNNNRNNNNNRGRGGNALINVYFASNARSVTITSTKDLSNVVLEYSDGVHQKFDGLKGRTGTFRGTGSNNNKKIKGVWVKSGSNASGDGPGYGQYFRIDK